MKLAYSKCFAFAILYERVQKCDAVLLSKWLDIRSALTSLLVIYSLHTWKHVAMLCSSFLHIFFSFISLRLLPLNQMYLFLMNICYLLLLLQKQCERKISREAKTQCMVNGDATHFQDFCIFFPPPMQNHLNSYTYSMENVWRKNTA